MKIYDFIRNIVLFILLCCITISSYAERIIEFSGFDRDDVPNLTLHVLKIPNLKEISSSCTDFDVMVNFEQIGNSFYFKGNAPNSKDEYFCLNKDYKLEKAKESDAAVINNSSSITVEFIGSGILIKKGENIIANLSTIFKKDTSSAYSGEYFVFNNGQSI
ncbi:MAG: hypothetical protein NTY47_05975, partial [Candidatus Omnitrophica bacterium]|nr:hypothetical protein [Candidatus Omnitrophota bacterium]